MLGGLGTCTCGGTTVGGGTVTVGGAGTVTMTEGATVPDGRTTTLVVGVAAVDEVVVTVVVVVDCLALLQATASDPTLTAAMSRTADDRMLGWIMSRLVFDRCHEIPGLVIQVPVASRIKQGALSPSPKMKPPRTMVARGSRP